MQKKAVALAIAAMISSGAFAQVVNSGGSAVLVDDGASGYESAGSDLAVPGVLTAGSVNAAGVTSPVVDASAGAVLAGAVVVDGPDVNKVTTLAEGQVMVRGSGGVPDTTEISGGNIKTVDVTATGVMLANQIGGDGADPLAPRIQDIYSSNLDALDIKTATLEASSATTGSAIIGGGSAVPGSELTVNGDASISGALAVSGNVGTHTLSTSGLATLDSVQITTTLDVAGSSTLLGAANTIGTAGTSNNTLQGASNTFSASQNNITGDTNSIIGSTGTVMGTGGIAGAVTGNRAIVDAASARLVSANGSNTVTVNDAAGVALAGNGATGVLDGTSAIYLNGNSSGLDVGPATTTLVGGDGTASAARTTLNTGSASMLSGTASGNRGLDINGASGSTILSGGSAILASQLELTAHNARMTSVSSVGSATTTTVDIGDITVPAGTSSGFRVTNGAQSIILNDGTAGSRSVVMRDNNGAVYVDNGAGSVGLRNGLDAASATARVNIGSTTGTVSLTSKVNGQAGPAGTSALVIGGGADADGGNITMFAAGADGGGGQSAGGILRIGAANSGSGGIDNAQGLVVNGSHATDAVTGVAASTTAISGGTSSALSHLSLDAVSTRLLTDDDRGLTVNTAATGGVILTGGTADGITGNVAALKIAQDGLGVSLLNSVADAHNGLDGHGLNIAADHARLTGGTNSSSLLLQDAQATLAVAGATGSAKTLLQLTTNATTTSSAVTIGEAGNTDNTLQGRVNSIAGTIRSSISGGSITSSSAQFDDSGIALSGNVSMDADLTVDGSTILTGALAANGGATILGGATLTGATRINTTGNASTTIGNAASATTVDGTLAVTGVTTLTGQLVANGSASISGGLNNNNGGITNAGTISGVANGIAPHDAVNVQQLHSLERMLSGGVAASTALANIPPVDPGQTFNFGLGLGHYNDRSALAVGGAYRFSPNGQLRASLASGLSGGARTQFGIGAGWSW